MNLKLILLSSFLLTSLAQASTSEKYQERCTSEEFQTLAGPTGSCLTMIIPRAEESEGFCVGLFEDSLPCAVRYIAFKDEAAMNLICGFDFNEPEVDRLIKAQAISYKVATVIKNSDGDHILKKDPNAYTKFSSPSLELLISKSNTDDGEMINKGEITIKIRSESIKLTDVKCK